MEITSKKELEFCMKADYMMAHGRWKPTFIERMRMFFGFSPVDQYLRIMRKLNYYSHFSNLSSGGVKYTYYKYKYSRLGLQLGFSISPKTFGYGLVIPHYGTIVVGNENRCGNYCVLHTSTCISGEHGGKIIGDGLYLSTGVKIFKPIRLGNNVQIGCNSVVNRSFEEDNIMVAGMPAIIKKHIKPWYIGWEAEAWHEKIESLRKEMNINL